jgi:hypothetical protein
VFVVGSDGTTHEANLKATKDGDGQLRKISSFQIEASNVVQINQGKDLIIFTTNPAQDQIQKVKIRNTEGQLTELQRVTGLPNTYSLAGYPVGVYVLDVIVQLSNNRQGAYETILVIIPPNQQPQPINFAVILQTIKTVIDTDIRIIIDNGDDDDDNRPPRCPEGQHWDKAQGKCIPDECPGGMTGTPPNCEPICPEGADSTECNPCIENPDLPECDPCIENPGLPECVEPCPDGRPRNHDGTCPPAPPDPCEENPNSPECQSPPEPCPEGTTGTPPDCEPIHGPPGPCEGEDCPSPPGAGLIPGPPGPEPEPGNGDNENGDDRESGSSSGGGSGGDGDNGDNGGSSGDGDGGESGASETE